MTPPAEKCAESTPGPWSRNEWGNVVDSAGNIIRLRNVAMAMSGSDASMAEADANTDLFVAAPDTVAERDWLKAANAELVAGMEREISKGCNCPPCNRLNAVLAKNKEQAP